MNIKQLQLTAISCAFSALVTLATPAFADKAANPLLQQPVASTYENVLPLQGGSNFRDLGGYETADGKIVKRGLLFRSGNMASLTKDDMAYLHRFGFKTVVDLRSSEELDLYPNKWAKKEKLNYVNVDYSMMELMAKMSGGQQAYNPPMFYQAMPKQLAPQLKLYFQNLVQGNVPLVVNCSAGQDRTGIASALLLSALGVPRDTVVADYLKSTQYRRPKNEMGDVDLEKAAETNVFAKMMLHYKDQENEGPKPLLTEDKTPYLVFALNAIDQQYGSVPAFLQKEIGVSEQQLKQLQQQYLN